MVEPVLPVIDGAMKVDDGIDVAGSQLRSELYGLFPYWRNSHLGHVGILGGFNDQNTLP